MSEYYEIVYQGRIIEGFDLETAKNKLIEKFSLSKEKAEKILKSRRVVLKKAVDETTARRIGLALKRAGLDVILAKSRPAAAVQPVTIGSRSNTEPQTDKTAAAPAAGLYRQVAIPAATAAGDQTSVKKTAILPFEFHGNGREYFKIWLVNSILTILTLGIYSAWAKVRCKRYIYGSVRLNGAGFEYLADPVKILKGRLIAGVVLVFYMFLTSMLPQISFLFSLLIFAAVPWIVVKALAFNARNSALRNIRFNFNGSVKDAAKAFVLWPILAPLTLGILAPYVYYRQRKFIVENSGYGTTQFDFTATARDYYRLFFGAFIPLILGVALVMVSAFLVTPLAIPVGLALYLYLFAFYSVKTTNLQFNSTQLAAHRFKSTLQIKEYLALVVTNSLATALTFGLFYPWAKIRSLRYKLSRLNLITSGDIDAFVAGEQNHVGSVGEEMSNFFNIDIGL